MILHQRKNVLHPNGNNVIIDSALSTVGNQVLDNGALFEN